MRTHGATYQAHNFPPSGAAAVGGVNWAMPLSPTAASTTPTGTDLLNTRTCRSAAVSRHVAENWPALSARDGSHTPSGVFAVGHTRPGAL
jgi:hypothetical protein